MGYDDPLQTSRRISGSYSLEYPAPLLEEGDLVFYQIGEKFYALYIHGIVGANEAPIVEFMDSDRCFQACG